MIHEPQLEFKKSIKTRGNNWYRIVHKLGFGGNSVTYLVLGSDGPVNGGLFALKLFLKYNNERRRRRFHKEIKFLKLNNHPSIMGYVDSGAFTIERYIYPFLIAEYLPKTLLDIIRENQSSFLEKSSYVVQLLSALNHISSLSSPVIHRDIKPQNIFIKGKTCLLGDFGLMTCDTIDQVHDRGILSESKRPALPWYYRTPDLVAFEKDGTRITPASDVFQLGLVATQLFTGRNPCVPAENLLDSIKLEPIGEIPIIKQGKGVRMLLNRMLEMNTEKRPRAEELLDPWREVFWEAANKAIQMNGKAF